MNKNKLWVVILNWNGFKDTIDCISSVLASEYTDYEILVVDNGSIDGSEEKIRSAYPKIKLVQTGSNLGYAGGNNFGIKYAIKHDAQYVLILNNDCRLVADTLTNLLATMKNDEYIGMVTPKVYQKGKILLHAGSRVDWSSRFVTSGIGTGEVDIGQHDNKTEVDMAPGDCVLVRASAIQGSGMIPEDYFLYYEDAAWSLEFKKRKYKIVYSPQAIAYHEGSHSTGGLGSAVGAYYILRNKFYFISKYGPLPARVISIGHFAASLTKNLLMSTVSPNKVTAKARLAALLDVLRGRRGKRV